MTDESGGDDLYTPAQYREHQEQYGERDPDAHPHVGLTRDKRLSRFLATLSSEYDPTVLSEEKAEKMPGTAEETELHRSIRRMEATETARAALDAGDMQTLKHLTGDTGQRADVSGIKAFETLKSFMRGAAPMFYEWAEPGTGKTNFALFLGQLWKRDNPNGLVASNIRTLMETDLWSDEGDVDRERGAVVDPESGDVIDAEPRDGWLSNFGQLEEWMEQDGDPMHNEQTPKLFIFDEASSSAGGSGGDGYQTKQKMGPLAYKIRKYGGSLIVIGHDGKDVHPLIREMGVCVHKEDIKRATFYEDVKNRSGVGEIETVEGIPETDWRYDDKEATTWSWSKGSDGEDKEYSDIVEDVAMWTIVNEREKEDPVAYRKLSKKTPWDASTCSRRFKRYKEDGKYVEQVQRVEDEMA